MPAALFIVAAILCAAFGGPLWATVLLIVLGLLLVAVWVVDNAP